MFRLGTEFWHSFNKLKPVLVADVGVVLGIAALVIDPNKSWTLEVRWIAFTIIVFLTMTCLIIMILVDLLLKTQSKSELPRVLQAFQSGQSLILVLEPSEFFFEQAIVSIFHTELVPGNNIVEKVIGMGTVSHIQPQQRIIQITLIHKMDGFQHIWDGVLTNNQTIIGSILCKPSIPYAHMNLLLGPGPH